MRLPRQTEGIDTIINLASGWRQRGRLVLVPHFTEVVVAINTHQVLMWETVAAVRLANRAMRICASCG